MAGYFLVVALVEEGGETLSVTLTSTSSAGVSVDSANKSLTVLITDDDAAAPPVVSITAKSTASQTEGNSGSTAFEFDITISSLPDQDVKVGYWTVKNIEGGPDQGTADPGFDYGIVPVGTQVTFTKNGPTTQTVTVLVSGEIKNEADETFFVQLRSIDAGNATISPTKSIAQGTILNDDPVAVGGTAVAVTVKTQFDVKTQLRKDSAYERLTQPNGSSPRVAGGFTISATGLKDTTKVDVYYSLSGTAANDGSDYELPGVQMVRLTAANSSADITILPIDDRIDEVPETVVLTITSASGYPFGPLGNPSATVTIYDPKSVAKPNDGSKQIELPLTGDDSCGCIGGTEDTSSDPTKVSLRHDDRAADPNGTYIVQTEVAAPATAAALVADASLAAAAAPATPQQEKLTVKIFKMDGTLATPARDFYFNIVGKTYLNDLQMGVQLDESGLPTDMYRYEFITQTLYSNGTASIPQTQSMENSVINHKLAMLRPDSKLGEGWSLAGLKTLKYVNSTAVGATNGAWINDGSGELQFFRQASITGTTTTYTSPQGNFSTLVRSGSSFKLTDKYKTEFTFDSVGKLTQEVDRLTRPTTYQYGTSATSYRLEKITAPFSQTVTFAYNSTTGNLDSITDADGLLHTFGYATVNGITRLAWEEEGDPDGVPNGTLGLLPGTSRTAFQYDAAGRLTRQINTGNAVQTADTEYLIDSRGRQSGEIHHDELVSDTKATWSVSPLEANTSIVNGRIPLPPNALGTASNPAPLMSSMASGQLNPDQTFDRMTFDADNRIAQTDHFVNGMFEMTTKYEYDANGLLVHQIEPTINGQTLEYRFRYDDKGNRTEAKTISNALATTPTLAWTYDTKFGQVTRFTDELGRITTYELDTKGNTTKITEPDPDGSPNVAQATGLLEVVTTITYLPNGLIDTVTLPDPDDGGPAKSSATKFEYDARGNVTKTTQLLAAGNLARTYEYDTTPGNLDRVKRIIDEDNKVAIEYGTYNALGLPSSITLAKGAGAYVEQTTTYEYDGQGHITKETRPISKAGETAPIYSYTYDARGRLKTSTAPQVSIVNPDYLANTSLVQTILVSPTTSYVYDLMGRLKTITDPKLGVTTYDYDEHGRLFKETLPDPDGLGATNTLLPTVTTYLYDDRNQLTDKIILDPDNVVVTLFHETYAYSPQGWIKSVTDELRNATTSYTYDDVGNMLTMTDARSAVTTYKYDVLDRVTSIKQPVPSSGAANGPEWKMKYDTLGRVIEQTDPLNQTTAYTYSQRGLLDSVTLPDPDGPPILGGLGGSLPAPYTKYVYTKLGEVDYTTDQLFRKTDYTYDRLSHVTKVELPDPDRVNAANLTSVSNGSLTVLSQSYTYDGLGRLSTATDTRGQTTGYTYNNADWLLKITSPDPDGVGTGTTNPLPSPVERFEYDANGWLQSRFLFGPTGNELRTNYTHDALGRLTQIAAPNPGRSGQTNALVSKTKYDGLGRVIAFIDPLNNVTTTDYDPANLRITVTQPAPVAGQITAKTVSTFDKVGNLVQLQAAANDPTQANLTTKFTYDFLNHRTSETDPFGKTLRWTYDDFGNVKTQTNRRDQVITWDYDKLNRPTKESWTTATTINNVTTTTTNKVTRNVYDSDGRLQNIDDSNLAASPAWRPEYVFAYDQLDRLTSVTENADSAVNQNAAGHINLPIVYTNTYVANGDLQTVQAALGTGTSGKNDFLNTYAYDNLGRVTNIQQTGTAAGPVSGRPAQPAINPKKVTLAYNAAGQLSLIVRGNLTVEAATTEFTYYDNGGLSILKHTHSGGTFTVPKPDGTTTTIAVYGWTYDNAGRVKDFMTPDGMLSYSYDNTDQLKSTTSTGAQPGSETFNFDSTGNRKTDGITNLNPVDRNRLLEDAQFKYTYDADGNLSTKFNKSTLELTAYTWDHRNRLTKVDFKNGANTLTKSIAYTYDNFDQRVLKQVDTDANGTFGGANDITERSSWNNNQTALVLDKTGKITHRFLYGPIIDQIFADEMAGTTTGASVLRWYLTDNQNTVRDVVNADGAVLNANGTSAVDHLAYSSFGQITSETDPTKTPFFTYAGRDLDRDTGLLNVRARWLDPVSGRWISEDPIRHAAADVNLQRYARNSPTLHVDRSGLEVKGANHFYPLFLGGSPDQTLFELSKEQHTAFHDYLRSQKLQGGQTGVSWDDARKNWSKLSEQAQRDKIPEGMRRAGIPENLIEQKIDDVMDSGKPGVNRSPDRKPKDRVKDKCSKQDIERSRKLESPNSVETPKSKAKTGTATGARSSLSGALNVKGKVKGLGYGLAIGYVLQGNLTRAAESLLPSDPLDLVNPVGTSQMGNSELRADDWLDQNYVPGMSKDDVPGHYQYGFDSYVERFNTPIGPKSVPATVPDF